MTIYYIDPGGAAGTGDGTSFANRAQHPADVSAGVSYNTNTNYYFPDGEHDIRFIKNPDEYTLSGGSVQRRGAIWRGYGHNSISTNYQYVKFSTTKGESQFYATNHALTTGDWIEWFNPRWYFNDANYGDPNSTTQTDGNYVKLGGLWKVTAIDEHWFKLNEFTAPFNKTISENWTSGGSFPVTISNSGYWRNVSSEVLEFSSALPIKHLFPERDHKKWTAHDSNTTTYERNNWNYSTWSNGQFTGKSNDVDVFQISSSAQNTTGKMAYIELPATLDLSAFQGISYELKWRQGMRKTRTDNEADDGLHNGQTDTGSGFLSIRLCTDTSGDTTAHTIPISTKYINQNYNCGTNQFNTGGNMNAAIKSIAIYKDGNLPSSEQYYFGIADIFAYKTSGQIITHRSHFGFKTANDPQYYFPHYIHNDASTSTYAIKLANSYRYYDQMYDSYGYYGTSGQWWSQSYTNATVTVQQPFTFGRKNSTTNQDYNYNYNVWDSQNRGHQFYKMAMPPQMFTNGPTVSNNSPTAWKKVTGGWNRTDMSSRSDPDDLTFFDQGWRGDDNGWRGSWGNSNVEWSNFYHSRGYGARFEGSYNIVRKFYCNVNRGMTLSASHHTHIDFFNTNTGGTNNLMSGNSQQYQGVNDPYASDGWKVHLHNHYGQESIEVQGFTGKTFAVFNVEMIYRIYIPRNDNYPGPLIFNDLRLGWHGRDANSGMFELYGDDQQNSVNKINQCTAVHGCVQPSNNIRLELSNYNHKEYPDITGNKAPASYPWYVLSGSRNDYSIYNRTNFFDFLSGSVERRFYTMYPMKINNIVNTDTTAHNLSGSGTYIMSANDGGVAGAGKYTATGWTMEPETTIRKTASGKSWKITKLSNTGLATHTVGKIAVAAGGTVTVKIWMYRTNSGVTNYGFIRIPSDVTLGITSMAESNNTSGSANTWEEVSVTASPTSSGIMNVDIGVGTDSSTSSGFVYFDDMTVEQS